MLRDFAGCLQEHLRAGDHAVRLGGDEFALVLFDADVEGALALLGRLRTGWNDRRSQQVDFSAGLTPGLSSPAQTREAADRALYAAKEAGKAHTVVAGCARLTEPEPKDNGQ